jgi:hypothetical protein
MTELTLLVTQATQVDDLFQLFCRCSFSHVARGLPIGGGKIANIGIHRVDQIVSCTASAKGGL